MAKKPTKTNQKTMFYTDHLTKEDKSAINQRLQGSNFDIQGMLGEITNRGLNVKISWSDFNNSYSATATPHNSELPHHGTFYSAFHASWEKAIFILHYLLSDRYDFGDWTRGGGKVNDNDW